jgi:hypothetical protein
MKLRRNLARIHLWLGWLIGIPLLFWTISGLWMVARPIEEVRGEQLKADPPLLVLESAPVFPAINGKVRATDNAKLISQGNQPVWIINFHDKGVRRASAIDGKWLPGVRAGEARDLALRAYRGKTALTGVKHFTADQAPLDLRKARPSWQAVFADGTHVYIDADSGEFLALRSRQWRIYDWFWGLHIMDMKGREDTHHPLLIGLAILATIGSILAMVLLPLATRWKHRRKPGQGIDPQ